MRFSALKFTLFSINNNKNTNRIKIQLTSITLFKNSTQMGSFSNDYSVSTNNVNYYEDLGVRIKS